MFRSPAIGPTGRRAPPSLRLLLLAMLILTAVATSMWRIRAGHALLPGMFTVVFLPVSLALFVLLDRIAGFGAAEWAAAASLVAAHLALSVPGNGGPLYYRGTHLLRPDHLVHLLAGALVAWLCAHVVVRVRPEIPGRWLALSAFALAIGFGAMKETTDFLSLQASHLPHDAFDSIVDVVANAIGAAAALWWLARASGTAWTA